MMSALLEIVLLKKRLLIVMGLLLVLNIVIYVVHSSYQLPAIEQAQVKWNDLRRRTSAVGRMDINALYKQGGIDLEQIKGRIPLKRDFPRVLGDILSAASANGVATGGITYKPQIVKDENLQAYGVSMNVAGSYAALKSFLADLQNNREMLVIEKIILTNGDYYEEKVSMDLHLTVYLREGA